ncbi:MAG: 2-oxo acid dehydrogenase subunit E2 [Pseudomonadota bacterium]|nr:2-oxo acid dehydrogenase subunit E2 [Pseudomonadota bacterium]
MDQLKEIKLHDLGEGLDGGRLIEWHVNENDKVNEGDIIASIETSKAIVELPAPYSGQVNHLLIPKDTIVNTGTTIAAINVIEKKESKQSIDLPLVGKPIHSSHDLPAEKLMRIDDNDQQENSILSTNLMIKNMMLAKQVVAASLFDDMIVDAFENNKNLTAQVIYKLIHALKNNPKLNAHFNNHTHQLETFDSINLGIAFNDRDDRLKVPIISNIDKLKHNDIEDAILSIKQTGMHSNYIDKHLPSPTFTLTNIGSIGGKYGTPVLIPPCVAILAIGKKEQKPIVKDEQIVIANVLPISLTFDHRILTGAQALQFLKDLCN